MKLALGTVQFGMAYGAFNRVGQADFDSVASIVKKAGHAGIKLIDTAGAYGTSEEVLGKVGVGSDFRIVTKCPPLADAQEPVAQLEEYFFRSLSQLKRDHIHGYMFHRSEDLLGQSGNQLWDTVERFRNEGKVNRIGVSVYHPTELVELLAKFPLTLVQLPANALMDWFYQPEYIELLSHPDLETHVRSAFLQGFLLSDPEKLTGYLAQWKSVLQQFQSRAAELGLSPLQACLACLMEQDYFDHIVVGIDSVEQLEEIIAATDYSRMPVNAFRNVTCGDPALTDPRKWQF